MNITYAMICETNYEDEDYLNCISWRESRIAECDADPDCEGLCDELEDDNTSCLMITECEPPQTCRGETINEAQVQTEEPIEEEPIQAEEPCTLCPQACEYIENDECGICNCPDNQGRCGLSGLREYVNGTNAYCYGGLLFEQKQDNESCQNSFECITNFCSKGICYDISNQVEENSNLLAKIWLWLSGLFG